MTATHQSLRSVDISAFALAPKGPHSPRGPRATADELGGAFEAFGLEADEVRRLGAGGPRGPRFHVVGPDELLVGRRFQSIEAELGEDSPFLLAVEGRPTDRRLAMWRNALWPLIHVGAILQVAGGRATMITMGGREAVSAPSGFAGFEGAILFGRRTTHTMSPDATVEKFDRNAPSWDGKKGAGYPHFRWMRRLVGRYVNPRRARKAAGSATEGGLRSTAPLRILDFGCGAGWVGIEAAKGRDDVELHAFDPSPEMVKIAAENAKRESVPFVGRTGFGEAPPFGQRAQEEDHSYDLVISSGVVSFSPDVETWLDGLVATVAASGDLVIGDIHPTSKGFMRRRRRKPLLPVREMNARAREEIRAGLEARGMVHVRSGAYQLTRPLPEAMHVNETRLFGILTYPLLWMNKVATFLDGSFGSPAQDRFDSWVMHFEAPDAWPESGQVEPEPEVA